MKEKAVSPQDVIDLYKKQKEITEVSKITGLSYNKVRKILITNGVWTNDIVEKIKVMRENGVSDSDIMQSLNMTQKTFNNYIPYSKSVYSFNMSENARRIAECRNKKRTQV